MIEMKEAWLLIRQIKSFENENARILVIWSLEKKGLKKTTSCRRKLVSPKIVINHENSPRRGQELRWGREGRRSSSMITVIRPLRMGKTSKLWREIYWIHFPILEA